jgi:hypothetical protein
MTKTATVVAAALLALASFTVAQASFPPAGKSQNAASVQTQTNDKVALMPRECGGCG